MPKDNQSAVICTAIALGGGQGKTLTSYMLGLKSALLGYQTLVIDADPQKNLTDLLRVEINNTDPSLLELLQGEVDAENVFYPVPDRNGLFIIPSDRALIKGQQYLAQVGNSAAVLKMRLKPLFNVFDLIIVDTPPQKSHLCLTSIGASHYAIITAEVAAKGVASLQETRSLLEECRDLEAFSGELAGVLPFRARWSGIYPTKDTRTNMDVMEDQVGDLLLPPLLESEIYKQALNYASIPAEINPEKKDLEYPFDILLHRMIPSAPNPDLDSEDR